MTAKTEASINMSTCEVSFKRSEYAVVVFLSMPETFPTDAHIECNYTVTKDYVPTTRDWIGLYKVGWISFHDYLYYEWAPLKNYVEGKELEGNILFPSHKMPGDDGDFYQFCYVASSGQVKGASTPFQFKKPRADDFVEMVDDENDMLIIRSKTCLLEETIQQKEEEKTELLKKLSDCDQKCSNLTVKLLRQEGQLRLEQESKNSISEDLKGAQNQIDTLEHDVEDLIIVQDELTNRVKKLSEEKTEVEDKVVILESSKNDLIEKLKTLQNQEDETLGKNKILQEENEMYKSQLSSREQSVFETQKVTEKLHSAMAEASGQIQVHEQENADLLRKLEKEKMLSASKKNEVARLSEKLRNSEDKLCAAESTKQMLQKELSAYEVTLKKMSSDLEASKGEYLTLKVQLQQTKKTQEEKIEELKKENERLKKETSNSVQPQSIYFLQEAHEALRQRLTNTMKQNTELSAQKEELTKKMMAVSVQNKELLNERKEWQLRVTKCSEEYKKIYAENKKHIKKLAKLKISMYTPAGDNSESSQSPTEGGSPSSRRSSTRTLNMEEMNQDLKYKEEKYENEERNLHQANVPTVRGATISHPDTNILEHSPLLYGNPYANNGPISEFKPAVTLKYPYPLPKSLAATKSFDSITTDGLSNNPNQKLPRPIEPTVLPSAKAAALKAVCSPNCEKPSEAHLRFFDSDEATTPDITINTDGEQFFEALGDEMRICPRCNDTFASDVSDSDFSEHIASHFGRVCPVCKKITDDEMTQEMFEHHVNLCLKCENPDQ